MDFKVFDLGLIDYKESWDFQKDIFSQVKSGILPSGLIICEHLPVITLGRNASPENLLAPEDVLQKKGINVYAIERGGDITYHGPGQLTIYPIFNLNYLKKDIHWFIRELEQIVMDFLGGYGIKAERRKDLTGAWVDKQKISSIGISIRNWITIHGLTINIKRDDLENFKLIRPCGMDIEMTSLESLTQREFNIEELIPQIISKFEQLFVFNPKTEALI